jgi:hypothetical protein
MLEVTAVEEEEAARRMSVKDGVEPVEAEFYQEGDSEDDEKDEGGEEVTEVTSSMAPELRRLIYVPNVKVNGLYHFVIMVSMICYMVY